MMLRQVLAMYCESRINLRRRTEANYESVVNGFVEFLGIEPPICDITASQIREYMRAVVQSGQSARTANNKRSVLITLWRFAAEEGLRSDLPPTIRRAREEQSLPQAWTLEQIHRALKSARQARTHRSGWGPVHWVALIHVCYATASRIGAVAKLPRSAFDGRYLRTPSTAAKSRRELIHRLPDACVQALNEMLRSHPRPSDDRLFCCPYEAVHGGIQEAFRRHVMRRAGLNGEVDRIFHGIRRHTYTVVADKLGFEAAGAIAGHTCDMRESYFDRQLAENTVDPVTALPELKAS